MTPAIYVPDRGDLIWIDFDPQAGHEQWGHRPGLVLSRTDYNVRAGLALICPITTRRKGYRYEVPLPTGLPVSGVILADQVRSQDWRARGAAYAGRAPDPTVFAVIAEVVNLMT